MKNCITIGVYSHVEAYPPSLSAIHSLSPIYDTIFLICSNVFETHWQYPPNVILILVGNPSSIRDFEHQSIIKKVVHFLKFSNTIRRYMQESGIFLAYDPLPVLAYRLIAPFLRKKKIWYHNHDVIDALYLRKYSLSWLAWKSEKWIFPKLDIFSLPSIERKVYFPMDRLKGHFFFIPNFPSKHIYKDSAKLKQISDAVRILYQGSIGELHGLEEIICLLKQPVLGKQLILVLKGFVRDSYKAQLLDLAHKYDAGENILFIPPGSYQEVITNTRTCHIGIGIHKKTDIMNSTLGTASNKIYEYAACGLPVLLFDNLHFRKALGMRKWVFFTDTSRESLLQCIEMIIRDYTELSIAAVSDFQTELCFERYIGPVLDYIKVLEHRG